MPDESINQLKLAVHDTYKKDEKLTTRFEPSNDEDVNNKAYLDEKLSETDGHLSFLEKITTNLTYTTTNNLWKKF